jgi:NAD-dependent dihydropyrimidine dehydrogenase PreA subunit
LLITSSAMGHLTGKDIYQKLGNKIDNLPFRVSKNDAFFKILKALYSAEEAELIVKMPYGLSTTDQIAKATGFDKNRLISLLENLGTKGLVVDMWMGSEYFYIPSPLVIGIFEFTMMRTGDNLDSKKWAMLFSEYLKTGEAYEVNFGKGQKISPLRALAHEGTISESVYTEVLDYEKATSIVDSHQKFSIGLCSCRHEKHHLGEKKCDVPLDTCITFGKGVDYMVRHNFAKKVSKTEILESLARSKEMGLVFSCDNVKKNVAFLCQCCGCCCNLLLGINKYGYANTIVTSGFIAEVDSETCEGCGKCFKACPCGAIEMISSENHEVRNKIPRISKEICIGCGVCSLKCVKTGSLKLRKSDKRFIHPETIFERVILQCLERGTLQHQIFANPEKITQKIMKGFIGGFLKLAPVQKALMSESLRSYFLEAMKKGSVKLGKGYLLENL